MRIKEIKTYPFSELSDKVKQKALETLADINVSFDWWEHIYSDANMVSLKLQSFDLDRHRSAQGRFTESASEVARLIFMNHGKDTETFKTAENYVRQFDALKEKFCTEHADDPDYDCEEDRDFENETEELEAEFLRFLLEDYSIMLQKEHEYRTSEAQVIEAIEANDYYFTEEGKLA